MAIVVCVTCVARLVFSKEWQCYCAVQISQKSIAPNTVWGVNLEQKARSKDRDEGKVSADVNVEE